MKILIDNVDSFIGSNLSNYFIQHTDAEIVGIVRTSGPYGDIEPSVRSRSRFQMQFMDGQSGPLKSRLAFERPDLCISVDTVDPLLQNSQSTIAISSKPVDCGVRNLLVPRVFGPRQRVSSGVAEMIWSEMGGLPTSQSTHKNTLVYVRDVFDELTKFMLSNNMFKVMSGVQISDAELSEFIRSEMYTGIPVEIPPELVQPLRHTIRWYAANYWVSGLR